MSARAERWIATMEGMVEPCLALRHRDQADPIVGQLGGAPSLAAGTAWPRVDGRPLSFIAEIDLAALVKQARLPWLPEDGRLHFFYDMVEWPTGFSASDRGHAAVLYTPAGAKVGEAAIPAELVGELVFPRVALSARLADSLPSPDLLREGLEPLGELTDEDWQRVDERYTRQLHYPTHQIGGHPNPIQAPNLPLEAQLASNGVDLAGPDGYLSAEAKRLAPGASDWRLLLQVDSDDDAKIMWGDSGLVYFMIREQDARARDFSRAWVLMQSM